MSTTTIRVAAGTHARLRALADHTGLTLTALIDRAVQALERDSFFDSVDAAYERLSRTPGAIEELEAEYRSWDGVSADGLDLG